MTRGWRQAFIFAIGLAAGALLFLGNQRQAYATSLPEPGFGGGIVCHVYSDLDAMGSPVNIFPNGCHNPPGAPPQCQDAIDNNGNGLIDAADPGCHTDFNANNAVSYDPDKNSESVTETTLALCSDGVDNDGNGFVDLADPSCAAFKPTLTVTTAVSGGTATPSAFALFLDGLGITSGVATTTSVGTHAVSETASSTYPGVFGGACDSSGHVSLAIGDAKTCTLTNTFTFTPEATTTTTPADVCPNLDGVQISVPDGKVLDTNDNCVDQSTGGGDPPAPPTGGGGGPPGPTGGGSGSTGNPVSGSGGGGGNGPVVSASAAHNGPAVGIILGTSTESCDQYLTAFIRTGQVNDISQVRRLQGVLKSFEGANLSINGVYDAATLASVEAFQAKYASDVLTPWGIAKPTGYVFLTTRKKVNEVYCKGTKQFPLTAEQKQYIQNLHAAAAGATATVLQVQDTAPKAQEGVATSVKLPAAAAIATTTSVTSPPSPGWWGRVQDFLGRTFR